MIRINTNTDQIKSASRTARVRAGLALCLTGAILGAAGLTHAAIQTWDNGAGDFIWGSSLNWGGAAWTAGNDAVFGASGVGTITVSGSQTVGTGTDTPLTFNTAGYTIAGGTLTLPGAGYTNTIVVNADATISAILTDPGTGQVIKTGTNNLTLNPGAGNTNSMGGLAVDVGTVTLSSGTLNVTGTTAATTATNANSLIIAGGKLTIAGGTCLTFSPSIQHGGTLTISNGTFSSNTELFNAYGTLGTINLNGGLLSANFLRVSQYAGNGGKGGVLNLNGGTLQLNKFSSGGSVGTVYFNGATVLARSSQASFVAEPAYILVDSTNGAILDTSTYTIGIANPLTHASALGATADGGLTKLGTGTLTLFGTNTYTGPTLINAGNLALSANGSISNSSRISITNGATFNVSALSAPFTLASGQTLSNNAASTGTLNGSLNTGSGTVSLSFAAGTPALLVASGTLTLSASTTFVIDNTGAQLANGVYPIITTAGTATITGTLPGSVTVTDGGAASAASLAMTSSGLYLVVGSGGLAPIINPQPVSLTRYVGGTAIFSAGVIALPAAQLHWQLNGTNISSAIIPSATNATLVLTNLQLSQAGTYVLTATNSVGGNATDGTAILTVLPITCSYQATILGYQPIGYWRFNDGESTTGYDNVGDNNVYDPLAAALQAGPQPTAFPGFESTNTAPAMNIGSIQLQGYASTVSLMNNRVNYTIMGWFNLDPTQYPLGADPFNNPQARSSLFGQNGAVELGFYGPVTGTNLYFNSKGMNHTIFVTNGFAAGQWEYVAVVSDANTTTFYLNGKVVGTATAGTAFANTTLFSIGKNVTSPIQQPGNYDTAFFPGSIDEVAVFDHALSGSAIQAIYDTGAGITPLAPTNVVANLVNIGGTNKVVITGSGGSGFYTVLTTTNLTTPLGGWTTLATGVPFGPGGSVNYTNAVSPATPQLFYRIRVP